MSDYYLADLKAEERARQRQRDLEQPREAKKSQEKKGQEMKVTLLGDFLFPTTEAPGCDPYNSTNGKAAREAWRSRRDRR
jgi:hypothetical protein